ncbi:MAG: GntR family transcriptional regulator [Chloroflexi bacterium]|nr:MAG: GntR family transcriptional regulator [Chloroflexota bacterium]
MHLDKHHPMPVYLQLKEMLRHQIEQGVYQTHQKLPSERALCQRYNLSRMTARKALQELIREGFAYTRVGKGTFVSDLTGKPPAIDIENVSYRHRINGFISYQRAILTENLLAFNCQGVEEVIRGALAAYSAEIVATHLLATAVRQIEELWLNREINLTTINFAVTTLRSHLITLFNTISASVPGASTPMLLACAPGDHHEIGLLLLGLSLRARGFNVIYLGPNVPAVDVHQVIEHTRPGLVCFSAATREAASALGDLSKKCCFYLNSPEGGRQQDGHAGIVFGGTAFVQEPALVSQITGTYLGPTIEAAVDKIEAMFAQ